MLSDTSKGPAILAVGALVVGFVLFSRPAYFADQGLLVALLGGEVLLLAVVKYKQIFFPLLIAAFVLASVSLPSQDAFLYGRWLALGVGALAGLVFYMVSGQYFFTSFHLIALFCVVSATVSAAVSAYGEEALLKAGSLALLFLYSATGARLAVPIFKPELFVQKLVTGCEIATVFIAISYLALRWEFFGNPNSLGAVMGVAIVPILLWGLMKEDSPSRRVRLGLELMIAVVLLMSSFARAGICAAAVACVFLCMAARQYRLLITCVASATVLAIIASLLMPRSVDLPQGTGEEPVSKAFLYKGHAEAGVLGSRREVWRQTLDVIKSNPWFGSGFGTSVVNGDVNLMPHDTGHINSWVTREHGNSYLAIGEWVGLLGVVPFFSLVLMLSNNVRKVFVCVRRTGDPHSVSLPLGAVVLAGLVHAGFEDWMFAVGYYLCVFFWVMAFILVDVLPERVTVVEPKTILMAAPDCHLPIAAGQ